MESRREGEVGRTRGREVEKMRGGEEGRRAGEEKSRGGEVGRRRGREGERWRRLKRREEE